MKSLITKKLITVNNYQDKHEIIIQYKKEYLRLLCDKDGIHVGEIKETT